MNILINRNIHRFFASYHIFLCKFLTFRALIWDRLWFRHKLQISYNFRIVARWHYKRNFIPVALTRVAVMGSCSHNQRLIRLKRYKHIRENIMLENITEFLV